MNFRVIRNILIALFIFSFSIQGKAGKTLFKARLSFQPQKTVFVRGEQNRFITWRLKCKSKQISGEKAFVSWGNDIVKNVIALPDMKKNCYTKIECPVPTYLREGIYQVKFVCGNQTREKTVIIMPRFNPMQMPVVMWGIYGRSTPEKRKQLREIGFTHFLNHGDVDYTRLNDVLADGFRILTLGGFVDSLRNCNKPAFQVTDCNGIKIPGTLFALSPQVRRECKEKATLWAKQYSQFSVWSGNNIASEIRDTARIDFSKYSRQTFQKECGIEIPVQVRDKRGVNYKTIKSFPTNQIISETNRIYRFYKWFWEKGDGWNQLYTTINDAIMAGGRKDIWNFHDPAVRCLAVYGSGGDIAVLSQWNYVYPNPIRIGFSTDELLCVAAGARNSQRVMAMTQIPCYRERLAPESTKPAGTPPKWLEKESDAPMITVPPDCLAIAFWSKISRPIAGIMYHGWSSLTGQYRVWSDKNKKDGYRYTTDDTRKTLKSLVNNVIIPFGPMLKKVPDIQADVAFLESFSSQIFTRNARSLSAHKDGWWSNNAYLILQYAHLQPEVIFEDTIIKNGLSKFKILVLVDCQVLPENVYQKIIRFQKAGGIIIGDENLTPAIIPDISVISYYLTGNPEADKVELLKRAQKICAQLKGSYASHVDSSNQNIIVRTRNYASADYLFIVNDNRTYGDYIGQFRKCMEKGIPVKGEINVRSKNKFLYNLITHKRVDVVSQKDGINFTVNLSGAEGRIYLLLPSPIDTLKVNVPKSVVAGQTSKIKLSIMTSKGIPVKAVIPVKIEIKNPVGVLIEGTGYYAAVNGQLTVNFASAINDQPGNWEIVVTELVSGLVQAQKFKMYPNNGSNINKYFPPVVETVDSACEAKSQTALKPDLEQSSSLKHHIGMLASSSPLIRRRAVQALGEFGKDALPAIKKTLKDNDSGVRRIALNVLSKLGAFKLDILTAALQDSAQEVQLDAIRIIQKNGSKEQRNLLKLALKSQFPEVRKNASEALMPVEKNIGSIRADADFPFVKTKTIKLPLNGWKFNLDQDNKGYIEKWFKKTDFSKWSEIEIGKPWENCGYSYDGIAWYMLDFSLPKYQSDAVELNFSAVDESAWVWVNGEFVGKHDIGPEGWKSAFIIDISRAVKYNSKNSLVVRVKDTKGAGGIWQPVFVDFYKKR